MSYDITKKRVNETGDIPLKDADGSPLTDEQGNVLSVTVHGPGSKIWQQAQAEQNRKQAERMRKNGGKIEAAMDHAKADQIEFLCRVTVSFNGWSYPVEAGQDQYRAAYNDDAIGFIREHVYAESRDWAGFTKGSAKG